MKISALETEHAQPGGDPLVSEKFFVQLTSVMKTSEGPRVYWRDADVDGNWDGFDSIERVQGVRESLIRSHHYGGGVQLRVIKRTCTVETEIAQ
jgi:hypothetical protein